MLGEGMAPISILSKYLEDTIVHFDGILSSNAYQIAANQINENATILPASMFNHA